MSRRLGKDRLDLLEERAVEIRKQAQARAERTGEARDWTRSRRLAFLGSFVVGVRNDTLLAMIREIKTRRQVQPASGTRPTKNRVTPEKGRR